MTEDEKSKDNFFYGPKYRLRTGRFVEPAHPDEVAYSWVTYDISRYFFEFVRNFLVVGALRYAADKTGNAILYGMFYVSIGVFVMFVYSFLCFWDLKIFGHVFRKSFAGPVLDLFLNVLISAAITFPLCVVIIKVTGQMADVR